MVPQNLGIFKQREQSEHLLDSPVAQLVKNPPTMWEILVQFQIPWRRGRLPAPVFWPGEFHGLSSPWVCKESDTTERLSLSLCYNVWSLVLSYLKLLQSPKGEMDIPSYHA